MRSIKDHAEESEVFRSLDKRQKFSEVNVDHDQYFADKVVDSNRACSNNVSDVADAIEDLLAQSNKVRYMLQFLSV